MNDTTSKEFRKALASAIKYHVDTNKLNGISAAKIVGCANSRMSTILRGQVEKISSDALVDILGTLGYRLDSVIGATEGHEFTLTLGHEETVDYIAHGGPVILSDGTVLSEGGLPKDIEPPVVDFHADKFSVINAYAEGKPFTVMVGTIKDGKVISSEVVMSNELEDSDPDAG